LPTTRTKHYQPLAWLFSAVFLDHTSINIIFPVLTIVCFDPLSTLFSPETSLANRSMWYGLIISIYHLVNIVAAPLFGIASDYLGRRKLLIIAGTGALCMGAFAALSLLASSIGLLLLGRVIGGFCATKAVTQAAVGDLPAGQRKVINMAYLQAIIALGALLGPLLGGFTAKQFYSTELNFSAPFLLATVFAALSLWAVWWKVPETLTHRPKPSVSAILRSIINLLKNHRILYISGLLFLSQISWSMYYQYMPPLLKNKLGFSAPQLGLFLSMIAFWLVLTGSFGIKLVKRWFSLKQLMLGSGIISLVGLICSVLALAYQTPWQTKLIWLAAIPVAAGDMIAYIVLTTLYSDSVVPEQQGLVMGLCLVVAQLVWFLTGILGGVLLGIHFILPLIIAPIGVMLLIGLLWLRPRFLHE